MKSVLLFTVFVRNFKRNISDGSESVSSIWTQITGLYTSRRSDVQEGDSSKYLRWRADSYSGDRVFVTVAVTSI